MSVPRGRHSGAAEALERCRDLVSESCDGSEIGVAARVLALYASFDAIGRAAFLDGLGERFSVDTAALQNAAASYLRSPNAEAQQALRQATETPLRELFLRLNGTPGGTAWLVRLREYLHGDLKNHPAWARVDLELTHVLRVLLNRGVLEFRQIDLETPFPILERLMKAEAVHATDDWREMARRLEDDRRCYAFFHSAWPDQPLIFTEVALTRGIASTIQPILDPDSPVVEPRTCDTAMFYSISNCQAGLRGFSFGNALLNGVIQRLRVEMPWVRRFATISPIPGFRTWLSGSVGSFKRSEDELLPLCAHYLLRVKQGGEPADAVARFHLGNGARLARLNPSSDLSPAGMRRSAGFTVNYVYDLKQMPRNAEAYRRRHEVRAVPEVTRLATLATPLLSTPSLVA